MGGWKPLGWQHRNQYPTYTTTTIQTTPLNTKTKREPAMLNCFPIYVDIIFLEIEAD
jgi:hypothetical protein